MVAFAVSIAGFHKVGFTVIFSKLIARLTPELSGVAALCHFRLERFVGMSFKFRFI